MRSVLEKCVCIEYVDLEGPLTEEELIALYQLLTKYQRTCGSFMDLMKLNTVRGWVKQSIKEVENHV
jgi:hypothetical protein